MCLKASQACHFNLSFSFFSPLYLCWSLVTALTSDILFILFTLCTRSLFFAHPLDDKVSTFCLPLAALTCTSAVMISGWGLISRGKCTAVDFAPAVDLIGGRKSCCCYYCLVLMISLISGNPRVEWLLLLSTSKSPICRFFCRCFLWH